MRPWTVWTKKEVEQECLRLGTGGLVPLNLVPETVYSRAAFSQLAVAFVSVDLGAWPTTMLMANNQGSHRHDHQPAWPWWTPWDAKDCQCTRRRATMSRTSRKQKYFGDSGCRVQQLIASAAVIRLKPQWRPTQRMRKDGWFYSLHRFENSKP